MKENVVASISGSVDGWLLGIENTGRYPDRTMSDKEWNAYMKQIDAVEENIRLQIEEEGKRNLAQADEARKNRRENWQEQWEEFLADARQHMKEVLQPESSGHDLLVQGSGLYSSDEGMVPYSEYMENGKIVYNGVVFTCNAQEHAICLGDMGDPKQVLTIPLAGGGFLKVNRNEIGTLAKAMGMFCPEDVGNILRAIAEDQQVQANQYAIEEEENRTMEKIHRCFCIRNHFFAG